MIDTEAIRESVGIREALEYYGLSFNKKGYALCPFHQEKTPSLYIYPKDNMFVCFSCGVKGDVIQFVQQLFNLSFKEAVKKIDYDFGLTFGKEQRENKQFIAVINKADRELKRKNREKYEEYCDELIILENALDKIPNECTEAKGILEAKIEAVTIKMKEYI